MTGHIEAFVKVDPDAVDPRYHRMMADKFGEPARFRWMNERTVNDIGLRGYHPVEKHPDDAAQQFNPDTRVRSGDRFLAAVPESIAQQYELEVRTRRITRLLSIQQGGQLGTEVAQMVRNGVFTPKQADRGFGGQGYMTDTNAAAAMGVNPGAAAPWLNQGRDSQPTPNEMAAHIESMHSKANLPEPSSLLKDAKVRALEAQQRWNKHTVNAVTAPGNQTLGGISLRKSGE